MRKAGYFRTTGASVPRLEPASTTKRTSVVPAELNPRRGGLGELSEEDRGRFAPLGDALDYHGQDRQAFIGSVRSCAT